MNHFIDNNHVCFKAASFINSIGVSLFNESPLNYFSYGRYYKNGYAFFLNNNIPSLQTWLDLNQDYTGPVEFKKGMSLWHSSTTIEQRQKYKHDEHNLGNGLSIYTPFDDYIEVLEFNTPCHVDGLEFYLNNQALLKRFGMYFKDHASGLIKLANKYLIYLPNMQVKIDQQQLDMQSRIDNLINNYKINNPK